MSDILEVQGLSKHYDNFSLKGVSFVVPRGYIMGFIGPNGAGKTTTLKMILGITNPDEGQIGLLGRGCGIVNGKRNSLAQNTRIGVVMEVPLYGEDWQIREVEKTLAPFYENWNRAQFSHYLHTFGLDASKKVSELSRGMRVKLQIAVALSHEAELLILDEPTSGLDPAARDEICDLLREFVMDENKAVLFSTHITSDLEKVADFVTFILGGSIVYTGTRDALLEKYLRVTGGLQDLSLEQQRLVIGYRQHGAGFEGMVEAEQASELPPAVFVEPVTLEELIIFMNEGGAQHA